jgi:hypothetical protein
VRSFLVTVHLAMAGFLVVSGAVAVAIDLGAGRDLGALPFVGAGLGLLGLIALVLASDSLDLRRSAPVRRRSAPGAAEEDRRGHRCSEEQ